MLKSRETRFKKSVEELNNRLGRAENFLDSELLARDSNMERIKFNNRSTQRSSLPAEVYRDKNTLVEVTVHRNPGNSKVHESRHQTWADSLSDTDVQYKKPTKSSLARVKKSPRKEKTSSQPVKTSTSKEKDRNIQDLMIELRDLLKVSGVDNIHDFVNEFAKKSTSRSQTTSKDLDVKIKDLQAQVEKHQLAAEKYKVECNRYKHEYGVLVKQVDISKDSVNSLEAQVADLKKIISRLTKNNGELLDIVKEKIKYEDIIADLEKKTTILNDELLKEKSNSEQLQNRLMLTQSENDNLRSLSADLRAHLRSGLSGLQYSKPTSRPASVPALGDDTKMILGVKNNDIKDDSDNDSAYDDPNTESLRSRPKSSRQNHLSVPQPGAKIATSTSPPTKMTNNPKPDTKIPGVSQLRMSKSPVRNLFPPPDNNLRTQSRSSTLVDAESINDDKSPSFQPLPLDLSETGSQADLKDVTDNAKEAHEDTMKQSLEDKVSDFLSRLHQDSVNLSLEIPQPRPFPGGSLHLSLSNSEIDENYSRVSETNDTTLTEGKFLRGLETSIEVLQNNISKHSE